MIDAGRVRELIEKYEKHGWVLRRVLLSASGKKSLSNALENIFQKVPIASADIDAAWFSRPPVAGGVAWEIRYLGDIPYAMLEKLDEGNPEFEEKLAAVESRLIDAVSAKRNA